jgi:hypothetical protein
MGHYLGLYIRQVRHHWVNLIAGAAMALIAFGAAAGGFTIPSWVFWVLAFVFLTTAQFRAFRDVRRELDAVQKRLRDDEDRRKRLRESREVTNETFHVWELFEPQGKPLVINRAFIGCVINGPAMVTFMGQGNISKCHLGEGNIESVLHEMVNAGEKQGIIAFVNCDLTRCSFHGIGYFGDQALLDKIRKAVLIL